MLETLKIMIENKLVSEKTCVHHWVINSPNGPSSSGSCRHCGAAREFLNAITWENSAGYRKKSPKPIDIDTSTL